MHRFKAGSPGSISVVRLRIKNADSRRNGYACVTCGGVYEDLQPGMNVHCSKLCAEAREGEVPGSFALGEGVNAVPDCADQYCNDNDRDDGSPLALLSNFLKHFLLTSLGQALPVHL